MADRSPFAERIVDGWERTETNNGVPYYISHRMQLTTWDHPYLTKVMEELSDYGAIRYAAYRTAFKIRHLQKKVRLHQIGLNTLKNVFNRHGYTEGSNDVIGCGEILKLSTDLYLSADQGITLQDSEAEIYGELLQNLILNLFDVNRTGCVRVLSIKLILITLCAARLAEKYKAFYQEVCDPSTYVSDKNFTVFLEELVQLPDLLQESGPFGQDVSAAVSSCLQMSIDAGGGGIPEDMFYVWLLKEPQTLVWLPTFHRTAAAETIKHESKCNICKVCPIVGFRYRCLKCFNFDMCQICFYTGRTKKKHKLKHPIQEYCLATSSKDDTKAFVKIVWNNISKKQNRKSKLKYMPVATETQNCQQFVRPRVEPPAPDIHAHLAESVEKIALIESQTSHDAGMQKTPVKTPVRTPDKTPVRSPVHISPHTVFTEARTLPLTSVDFIENKENKVIIDDGLKQQRKELERVIEELEEENRKLHEELVELKKSDTETELTGEDNSFSSNKHDHSSCNPNRPRYLPLITNNGPLSSVENVPPLRVNTDYLTPTYFSPKFSPQGLSPRNKSPKYSNQSYSPGSQNYSSRSHTYSPRSRSYSPRSDGSELFAIKYGLNPSTGENSRLSPYENVYDEQRNGTAYDSLDFLDVSPSHFTLPSFANSRVFLDEEAEMEELVEKAEAMFPNNFSYSAFSASRVIRDQDEMLQAASSIGTAMTEFVNGAMQQQNHL